MSSNRDNETQMSAGLPQDFVVTAEIKARRVNEAIDRGMRGNEHAVFLCECGILGCSRTVELSLADYGKVRASFDHFLIAAGHEIPAVDRVIREFDDHVVVAKRGGRPAELARVTDPRAEEGERR